MRARVLPFPPNRMVSHDVGLFSYRASRSPGEVVRQLTEALQREIRVSDELGVPVSNDTLRDIVSWGERGCLPS